MKHVFAITALAATFATSAFAQDDKTKGEQIYNHWCVHCHGDGPRYPGTQALEYRDGLTTAEAALANRTDLDHDVIEYFIRNGSSIMPTFRKTELSVQDVRDISAYLTRNNAE